MEQMTAEELYSLFQLSVLFVLVVVLVGLSQFAIRRHIVEYQIGRKALHIGAIGISACTLLLDIPYQWILLLVGACIPILWIAVSKGFFQNPESGKKGWGIPYFAVSFWVLLLFYHEQPILVFYPMITMALADGCASIVGHLWGRTKYHSDYGAKSWEGSLAFFLVAVFCLGILPVFIPQWPLPFEKIYVVIAVSLVLALIEAVFEDGFDNITVPFGLLYWVLLNPSFETGGILFAILGLVLGGILAWRIGWLTSSGAMAAIAVGVYLVVSPEPKWVAVFACFFVFGSILSKLPSQRITKEPGGRNMVQVMANGGIPLAFVCTYFVNGNVAALMAGVTGIACAMSDTASAELGTRLSRTARYLTSGRNVLPGLSGGISVVGTFAGVIFSFVISGLAYFLTDEIGILEFIAIGLIGMLGNLIDSLVGALWQVKFKPAQSREWRDTKPPEGEYEMAGVAWLTNDYVNLIAVGISCIAAMVWFSVY